MKFRKKPVVIDAHLFTPEVAESDQDIIELAQWCNGGVNWSVNNNKQQRNILIETSEGIMKASVGDWIIRRVKGEFYPCKPDIFKMTYEHVLTEEF